LGDYYQTEPSLFQYLEEEDGFDSRYISKNDRATLRSPAYCGD